MSDVEYYIVGFFKIFMKNKMIFFVNGGLEWINLDDFEKNGICCLVGFLNFSYILNEKWFFNIFYFNFENIICLKIFDLSVIVDFLIFV